MATPDLPQYWLNLLTKELFQHNLPWWLNNSLDKENGGYFNCINEDGSLFDTNKYIWLQGRQVWMLAKLYGDPKFDDKFFQDLGLTEIDNNVLEFSKWFSDWNHNVLQKPNTKIFVQDGRAFLRWSKTRYDVIIMEPMSPLQSGVVNLYSKEFYDLALNHLKENGILVQWLPLHLSLIHI